VFAASIKTVKYEYEGVEDLLPLHSSGCSSCSIEINVWIMNFVTMTSL